MSRSGLSILGQFVQESYRVQERERRGLSFCTIVAGGFLLITVVVTYPLILNVSTHIPFHKELPPAIAEHWMWTWSFWFIRELVVGERTWSLFTDVFFYPRGVDLTYPLLFGLGLPVAVAIPVVRLLGVVPTFNLFIFVVFVVTAYATFILVRDLTNDRRASFISGFIFAFSPFQMVRTLGHFGIMTSAMWIPLYVLFFMRAIRHGNLLSLILAPLVLALACISNPYYAIFLGIFTIMYCGYYLITGKIHHIENILVKRLLPMGCLVVVFLIPVIWITLTYGREDFYVYAPLSNAEFYSADLLAFFLPSPYHPIWGYLVSPLYYTHFTGNVTEQTVYLGYMVLILSVIAIVKVDKEQTRFWVISAVAFFILSLGPFLHINGRDALELGGMSVSLPLPNLPMHFVPLLKAMRVPSRFAIMLMLALAVLAGYGVAHLLKRFEGKPAAGLGFLLLIITIIGVEFSIGPLPLIDARIPQVYEGIAKDQSQGGTLLDVPLYWSVGIYQHYQTIHHKRLLYGQVPRLSPPLVLNYGDSIPFIKLFKNPELIKDYNEIPVDKSDILRFIEFFDLSFIVIHKDLLAPWFFPYFVRYPWDNSPPNPNAMQAPEVFDRLMRFFAAYFPVVQVEEDGDIVVLKLSRPHQIEDLWAGKDGYIIDFGSSKPQFFLSEGWSIPEHWGERTVAWANAKESRLWVYFPRAEDMAMELQLLPFTFPDSPPQSIKIYVNGQFFRDVQLEVSDWRGYTLHLPRTYLTAGINAFRFVYGYIDSPSKVVPGSDDSRPLAVAFDYITFHRNEGG
jgi:hypothetical protein